VLYKRRKKQQQAIKNTGRVCAKELVPEEQEKQLDHMQLTRVDKTETSPEGGKEKPGERISSFLSQPIFTCL